MPRWLSLLLEHLTVPLLGASALCGFGGILLYPSSTSTGIVFFAGAVTLFFASRLVRTLAYPPLPTYLRDPRQHGRPKGWEPKDGRSDSTLVWSIVRPVAQRWVDGRYSRVQRDGQGDRVVRLADLVSPCDTLVPRLSAAELATARQSGVLPTGFWLALAHEIDERVPAAKW